MNYKLNILVFAFFLSSFYVSAKQERPVSYSYFSPEWYVGVYAGSNLMDSEGFPYVSLNDAIGLQSSFVLGYQFIPELSFRAGVDFALINWPDSRTTSDLIHSFGTQSVYIDMVFNLSNAFEGYSLHRKTDISVFAGLGGIHRNTASFNSALNTLHGRVGGQFHIHLTQFLDINFRAEINFIDDDFNEFVVDVPVDILSTTMIGLTYHFRTIKLSRRGCCY